MNEFPKEWYWMVCLILFFLERDFILDTAFMLIDFVFKVME